MMQFPVDALRIAFTACAAALMLAGNTSHAADAPAQPAPTPGDAQFTRSVVDAGDTSRLRRVFDIASKGQPITVLTVGGSITAGAKATKPENQYGSRIGAWWKAKFPKSNVTFVNAGIGATGSGYGSFRADRDIFSKNPDVVVVEFAVNDGPTLTAAASYEGLLRKLLSNPRKIAVIQLFMMHQGGENNQKQEVEIGKHYGMPMISYRDAVYPDIKAGTVAWESCMADDVHPNDAGHAYAAALVTHYLDALLASPAAPGRIETKLPDPLYSDTYQFTNFYEAPQIRPTRADGWTLSDKGYWTSSTPGSVFECDVDGQSISLMTYRIKGAMGRAKVTVDDQPPTTIDGWFNQTWGGYIPVTPVGGVLPAGKHHVRIELTDQKADESTGYEFRIISIGAAGASH